MTGCVCRGKTFMGMQSHPPGSGAEEWKGPGAPGEGTTPGWLCPLSRGLAHRQATVIPFVPGFLYWIPLHPPPLVSPA